jgi:hypothetical protein
MAHAPAPLRIDGGIDVTVSILDQAIPAAQVADAGGFVWGIFGKTGVGKTHLAATAGDVPGWSPVLFVSTDRSVRTITHRPDVRVLLPETWDQLSEIYKALAAGSQYKTVVVDTLSAAISMCQDAVLKETGRKAPTMDDYAAVNKRVIAMVRRFSDLALQRGMIVIFTAWEVEIDVEDEGRKFTRIQPDFSSRVNLFAPAAMDGLMRLAVIRDKDGKPKRVLTLTSQPNVLTKFRVPLGTNLPERLDDPTLPKLFALLQPQKEAK